MDIISTRAERATLELTLSDVILLNNALNEVCNGIDVPEFSTRIGATIDQAEVLLRTFGSLLRRMEAAPDR